MFLKRAGAALICGWLATAPTLAGAHEITDMAGRHMQVPDQIRKVYCMSPVCQVMIYTLAPDLLAGWDYQPTPGELKLIAPQYRHLPVLGGWFGKNTTGNIEQILKIHPDIMISVGPHGGGEVANRVTAQTRIPVYLGEMEMQNMPETYIALGKLLHREKRAKILADYSRDILGRVAAMVAKIPEAERRRVYYAEGPDGLATDPGNSFHSAAIVYAGGVNVAHVPQTQIYGQTPVSMEQVLNWNPDVIITGYDHKSSPGTFFQHVWKDPLWHHVRAVQTKDVYESPQYPFNWVDRPPATNRIIGIAWLAHTFYPKQFPFDLRAETRKFYDLFYHYHLTDAELNQLLAQSVKHP